MTITYINPKIKEIEKKIEDAQPGRNLALFYTGCWTLCGSLSTASYIKEPSMLVGVLAGASSITALLYILNLYMEQKNINELNYEKREIEIENEHQKTLTW